MRKSMPLLVFPRFPSSGDFSAIADITVFGPSSSAIFSIHIQGECPTAWPRSRPDFTCPASDSRQIFVPATKFRRLPSIGTFFGAVGAAPAAIGPRTWLAPSVWQSPHSSDALFPVLSRFLLLFTLFRCRLSRWRTSTNTNLCALSPHSSKCEFFVASEGPYCYGLWSYKSGG